MGPGVRSGVCGVSAQVRDGERWCIGGMFEVENTAGSADSCLGEQKAMLASH